MLLASDTGRASDMGEWGEKFFPEFIPLGMKNKDDYFS